MIRPLPLNILDEICFVPRAIVATPVRVFAEKLALKLVEGEDDLDRFEGLILVDNDVPFTLTCHRGHASDQTTLSLPVPIGEVRQISDIIGRILGLFRIDAQLIMWQQDRDDPPRMYA